MWPKKCMYIYNYMLIFRLKSSSCKDIVCGHTTNMIILHHEPKISNHRLLVADVLRQFSLPFLHAFWPLKSHKFGDDIQGTVSNTNMTCQTFLRWIKKRRVWEATAAYTNIKITIYRHITPPISMTTRRTSKLKLIVVFHHQCTLAYYRDQGPRKWNTDETIAVLPFFRGGPTSRLIKSCRVCY